MILFVWCARSKANHILSPLVEKWSIGYLICTRYIPDMCSIFAEIQVPDMYTIHISYTYRVPDMYTTHIFYIYHIHIRYLNFRKSTTHIGYISDIYQVPDTSFFDQWWHHIENYISHRHIKISSQESQAHHGHVTGSSRSHARAFFDGNAGENNQSYVNQKLFCLLLFIIPITNWPTKNLTLPKNGISTDYLYLQKDKKFRESNRMEIKKNQSVLL